MSTPEIIITNCDEESGDCDPNGKNNIKDKKRFLTPNFFPKREKIIKKVAPLTIYDILYRHSINLIHELKQLLLNENVSEEHLIVKNIRKQMIKLISNGYFEYFTFLVLISPDIILAGIYPCSEKIIKESKINARLLYALAKIDNAHHNFYECFAKCKKSAKMGCALACYVIGCHFIKAKKQDKAKKYLQMGMNLGNIKCTEKLLDDSLINFYD